MLLNESRREKPLNKKISKGKRNLVIKVWFPKLMIYFLCLSRTPQNFLFGYARLLFIGSRSDTSFSVDTLKKCQKQSVNFGNFIPFRCNIVGVSIDSHAVSKVSGVRQQYPLFWGDLAPPDPERLHKMSHNMYSKTVKKVFCICNVCMIEKMLL